MDYLFETDAEANFIDPDPTLELPDSVLGEYLQSLLDGSIEETFDPTFFEDPNYSSLHTTDDTDTNCIPEKTSKVARPKKTKSYYHRPTANSQ